MDREGFKLIDKTYQQEVAAENQAIEERIRLEYAEKSRNILVNHKDVQQKLDAEMNKKIEQEQQVRANIRGQLHFGDGGREAALKKIQEQEQRLANENTPIADDTSSNNERIVLEQLQDLRKQLSNPANLTKGRKSDEVQGSSGNQDGAADDKREKVKAIFEKQARDKQRGRNR